MHRLNPLDCLIRTILSQKTSDRASRPVFAALKEKFPKWEDVASAPLRSLERVLKPAGLCRQKSRSIRRILFHLRKRGALRLDFLREMSDEAVYTFLTGLLGVGQKTAKIVMLFSLGREAFPVDTHIARVSERLGLVPFGSVPERTSSVLERQMEYGGAYSLHLNIIRLGRERCKARRPLCIGCPLVNECLYIRLHSPEFSRGSGSKKGVKRCKSSDS